MSDSVLSGKDSGSVAVAPWFIAKQISDQYTPYCNELEYAVLNKSRVLAD